LTIFGHLGHFSIIETIFYDKGVSLLPKFSQKETSPLQKDGVNMISWINLWVQGIIIAVIIAVIIEMILPDRE